MCLVVKAIWVYKLIESTDVQFLKFWEGDWLVEDTQLLKDTYKNETKHKCFFMKEQNHVVRNVTLALHGPFMFCACPNNIFLMRPHLMWLFGQTVSKLHLTLHFRGVNLCHFWHIDIHVCTCAGEGLLHHAKAKFKLTELWLVAMTSAGGTLSVTGILET